MHHSSFLPFQERKQFTLKTEVIEEKKKKKEKTFSSVCALKKKVGFEFQNMLQKNLSYFRLDPTAMKSVGAPLLSSGGTEPGP